MASSNPDVEFALQDQRIKRRIAIRRTDNVDESITNNGGIERG